MNFRLKHIPVFLAMAIGGLGAMPSHAADTICSVVYDDGSGLAAHQITATNASSLGSTIPFPLTTVAIASNFYQPAISLVKDFMVSAGYDFDAIGICHNATGHLMQEITGGGTVGYPSGTYAAHPAAITGEWLSAAIGYKYSLLLAANETAPKQLASSLTKKYTISSPLLYAKGIPALLLNPNEIEKFNPQLTAAALFVASTAGSPEGVYYSATAGTGGTGPIAMSYPSYLSPIGVALPSAAPYGLQAKTIVTAMGQWPTAAPSLASVTGSGVCATTCSAPPIGSKPGVCQYDNIDLTYAAAKCAGSGIKAGWVSLAQIREGGDTEYIAFPAYPIAQWGVLLDAGSPSRNKVGRELWQFMNLLNPSTVNAGLGGGKSWNQWLDGKGYGGL